ncbi:MAG TPA: hypothetical protein PLX66_03420, partial [Bacilli bacterium]|nr:hypothetical protein [Bacilli bacterium]
MIKLIKNELIKIFHKKSIYIILAICLAFVILTNYIYKNVNTFYSTADNKEYINSLIEEQKTIDLSNSDNIDWYVSNQTEIDMYNLKEHYGTDSWQSALIVDRLYETIYQINYLTYGKYKNSTELKKLQKEYNDIITKFDSDDWRSFVEDEITELNKTLKEENKVLDKAKGTTAISEAERNVFVTELDIEIANLRLDQNISYGTDYLNTAINSYKYAKTDWYDTKDIERDYDAEVSYQETLKTIAMAKYSIDNKYNSYEEESNMKSIYESFLDE